MDPEKPIIAGTEATSYTEAMPDVGNEDFKIKACLKKWMHYYNACTAAL